MRERLTSVAVNALILCLFTGSALAHEEHCHTKDAQGSLADNSDAKTKKACDAKGGTWFHHHQHCHKADAGGKMTDVKGAKDQKSCDAQGGSWTDHGHEASAAPATTK